MAGMDHDSYWHGYLMARHHTFLILGIVLMVMSLIFTLTGRCLVRFQGINLPCRGPQDVLADYCPVLPAWPSLPSLPWTLLIYGQLRPSESEISN
jgi:hypothetical protein